jgi:tRNA 2-selenouridine synthase
MIKIQDCLNKGYLFIDVRTPKEFNYSTIPGAINIPLFSNQERAIIGKLYKEKGQQKAIKEGFKIISKSLNKIILKFKEYKNHKIVIFCWRGGMRSKSIVNLLKTLDFNVKQLEGGYKSYRHYIREKLNKYKIKPKLVVIHGLTGTGKTRLINKFKNSIDLEGLAQHRSSLFGSIGLKPRSQKMFDSLLFNKLEELKNKKYILIEGESRKIGNIIIPESLFKAMKKGVHIKINLGFEKRVKNILRDYGDLDKKELAEKVKLLKKFIGKKKINLLLNLLEKNKKQEVAEMLLKDYYDPLYKHTINNIKYDLEITKESELRKFLNEL